MGSESQNRARAPCPPVRVAGRNPQAPLGDSYGEEFLWYRSVDADGKGAPKYFNHLDWDGDGDAEILLDVFDSNRRWYAALARRGDRWVRTSQDTCTAGPSAGG